MKVKRGTRDLRGKNGVMVTRDTNGKRDKRE